MKKILLTSIALAGLGVSAFGQGQIVFENASSSSTFVTLNSLTGPTTGSGLVVKLFWNNGSSFVLEDTFTSTFAGSGGNNQALGQFNGGELTIPSSGAQSFQVEGFYTTGGNAYSGTTVTFTAPVNVSPSGPVGTDAGGSWTATPGHAGDLVLNEIQVPEPTTIALGGLGAAALLLFRRRK